MVHRHFAHLAVCLRWVESAILMTLSEKTFFLSASTRGPTRAGREGYLERTSREFKKRLEPFLRVAR